jgi:hypothetical protein
MSMAEYSAVTAIRSYVKRVLSSGVLFKLVYAKAVEQN